jgi:hypothetical protein
MITWSWFNAIPDIALGLFWLGFAIGRVSK